MIDAIQGTVDRPEAFATALPEEHINVLRAVAVVIEDGAGNTRGPSPSLLPPVPLMPRL